MMANQYRLAEGNQARGLMAGPARFGGGGQVVAFANRQEGVAILEPLGTGATFPGVRRQCLDGIGLLPLGGGQVGGGKRFDSRIFRVRLTGGGFLLEVIRLGSEHLRIVHFNLSFSPGNPGWFANAMLTIPLYHGVQYLSIHLFHKGKKKPRTVKPGVVVWALLIVSGGDDLHHIPANAFKEIIHLHVAGLVLGGAGVLA